MDGVSAWWSNQNLQALFLRILTVNSGNPETTPWVQWPRVANGLGIGSVVLLSLFTIYLTRSRLAVSPVLNLGLWLTLGMLISPATFDHYLTWLLIPVVLIFWKSMRRLQGREMAALGAAYFLISFPSIKLSSFQQFHQGPLLFLSGLQTFGMVLLYGILGYHHLDRRRDASWRGGNIDAAVGSHPPAPAP